jgi:hypothetical protein
MLSSAESEATLSLRLLVSPYPGSYARLNQSQHHDLLLIENKYTEHKAIYFEQWENEKLKSHFCHTKGNRLKLNKERSRNLIFVFANPETNCDEGVVGEIQFSFRKTFQSCGWSNCNRERTQKPPLCVALFRLSHSCTSDK